MSALSIRRRAFVTLAAGGLCAAKVRPAIAGQLAAPIGKVILSISGKISVTNDTGVARFDRDALEALGLTEITTATPWYDAPMKFEGIRLDRLMKVVGATGEKLQAKALDDYATEIPIADFESYKTLLALKRNGEFLSVKDKGPLFIVYPFDDNPVLKHQRFFSRCAWSVRRMTVV